MGATPEGLNAAEQALAWAIARHGGEPAIVGGLEPDAAADMGAVVAEIAALDAEARRELAASWAERHAPEQEPVPGGERPRDPGLRGFVVWSQREEAGPATGLSAAASLPALAPLQRAGDAEARGWFGAFGLYQFAEVLRLQDRRRLARALRDMPAAMREGARRWLRVDRPKERPMAPEELTVVREAFIGISRHHPDVADQMWHLGMYLVALAAGDRYAESLRAGCAHLGREQRRHLDYYRELCARSTRRSLTRAVRASLTDFGSQGDEHNEPGGGDGGA